MKRLENPFVAFTLFAVTMIIIVIFGK